MTTTHRRRSTRPPGVTTQQVRILALVAIGWTADRIARELGICVRTVERELHRLRGVTGAESVTHAAVIACRQGWLPDLSSREALHAALRATRPQGDPR